jgi:hypothetical protein
MLTAGRRRPSIRGVAGRSSVDRIARRRTSVERRKAGSCKAASHALGLRLDAVVSTAGPFGSRLLFERIDGATAVARQVFQLADGRRHRRRRCSPTSLDPDEFPHTAIRTSCGAAVDNSDGLLDRGRARTQNAEVLRARLLSRAPRSAPARPEVEKKRASRR